MKQEPPQTPTPSILPETLLAPIDINELMDVFSVDPNDTTTIYSNIKDVIQIIDQKHLAQAKVDMEKHQWYNARYTLNAIKDQQSEEIHQLREDADLHIKIAQEEMDERFFSSPLIKKSTIQQVYPNSNIGIGVKEVSINTGVGMEYGHYVLVWHNGIIHKRYFAYRDDFDAKKDHWEYHFDDIKHVDIEKKDGSCVVTIVLKSTIHEHTTIFTFPDHEERDTQILSPEEQKKFTLVFESKKQELLEQHVKSQARMPMNTIRGMIPGQYLGSSINDQYIPYRRPEIHDEYVDPEIGMGIIIIKSQIDYDHLDGMQFERSAYKIDTNNNSTQLSRETRYESQIEHGNIITMKAEDFL